MIEIVGVLLALFLLSALVLALRRRGISAERRSRPRGLLGSELVYMEKLFRTAHPFPLVARVDRVYRRAGGSLVLVELKMRDASRVHETDLIQLSVQKIVIEAQTGEHVESKAFLSFASPTGKQAARAQSVRLFGTEEIVALARRREAILAGRAEPTYARSVKACSGCAFRSECDRFADRR